MPKKKDLTGKKFGMIEVIKDSGERKRNGDVLWLCKCKICGKEAKIRTYNLKKSKSCGCLSVKNRFKKTHGKTKSSEYIIWAGMKSRCLDINNQAYKNYGGRGIKVCNRWINSFENFLNDMGQRPSKKYTIDRIDNNSDYEPENCKWSTYSEQNRNRRNNKLNKKKVKKIRKLLNEKELTKDEIGKIFNVHNVTIYKIKNNKIWKEI